MDGNKSIHDKRRIRADGSGTFDSICDGINKILDIGIKVNLRINTDAENIGYLGELKEVFEKQGGLLIHYFRLMWLLFNIIIVKKDLVIL